MPSGELFRQRGSRHQLTLTGRLPGLALSTAGLTDDEVVAEVTVEAQGDTVTMSGTVTGRWAGDCRRCLEPTGGAVVAQLSEVFEPVPVEGETYPLGRDDIDVEPALREALALALPLAPLCDDACAGPDPETHPVTPAVDPEDAADAEPVGDPRWGALDALRFDS